MQSKLKNKKLPVIFVILEVIIGGFALVYIASAMWNKPLGPSLEMSDVASAQEMNSSGLAGMDSEGAGSLSEVASTPASLLDQIISLIKQARGSGKSLDSNSLCGGPPVMTILLVGSDERGHDYLYGLADTVRLVRIDFTTPKVMMVDIPRDLWVEIPDISDHYGISQGKLNQAYFFGNPGMGYYDGPGEGPGLLARTLELNYGLVGVDHYLAMDRSTFSGIIDAMGGIDVHLDSMVDFNAGQDGANPDYVLQPGDHHLDGEMALKLASHRNPTTFQRARFQNIVLKAVQTKLLNPAIIPEIPGLIAKFVTSVQTDLSANEVNQLICIGQKLIGENTQIVEFPDDMFISGRTYDPYRQVNTFTLSVDNQLMRSYFTDFMNGIWP
jgi:LCP family protein required for cell wall assembly